MQEILRMFTRILRNLLEDSEECYHFNIPVNVREDSSECSRRFRGMFQKIPWHVRRDSVECSRRFWKTFLKIRGKIEEDSWECYQRFSKMIKRILRLLWQEIISEKLESLIFLNLEKISTETKFLIKGHYFSDKGFPWYCKARVISCELKA